MNNITDNHTHIFNEHHIPSGYIGSKILQSCINKYTLPVVTFLDFLIPFSKKDRFSRYAELVKSINKTQLENLLELFSYYPPNSVMTILTINFEHMKAGKCKKSYEEQLVEVVNLKKAGYNIKIFYCADPRANDLMSLLIKYEDWIDGIKLYPLMGYFPYDERLNPVYEWCRINKKPVISHCAPENPTHYRGSDIDKLLAKNKLPVYAGKNNKQKASNFAHPKHLAITAEENAEINFSAAHFGGDNEIDEYMKDECYRNWTDNIRVNMAWCNNLYADISCIINEPSKYAFIQECMRNEVISPKLLYGSDFHVNKITAHQSDYTDIKYRLSLTAYEKLMFENTERFYKTKK